VREGRPRSYRYRDQWIGPSLELELRRATSGIADMDAVEALHRTPQHKPGGHPLPCLTPRLNIMAVYRHIMVQLISYLRIGSNI
jgi:hypothetical protein